MIDAEKVVAILGRPLTSNEQQNFDLYLDIAVKRVGGMLCMTLDSDEDPRVYDARYGYSSIYVDPFTAITSVKVNGETLDAADYTKKQNDSRQGTWFNVIEFKGTLEDDLIEVEATWGFGEDVPADLAQLLAEAFAMTAREATTDLRVQGKKIEDFSVTYRAASDFEALTKKFAATIYRYSQCGGTIDHGVRCL